jgi:hypothetical protein
LLKIFINKKLSSKKKKIKRDGLVGLLGILRKAIKGYLIKKREKN